MGQNAHKQQKTMDKSKTRKQVAKIATLIVFAKVIQTSKKKKNKKMQTPAKNIFQRKVHSFHTEKVGVNTRKTKQYSEAGQASPKHVANRATKKFGYNLKKKNEPIRI